MQRSINIINELSEVAPKLAGISAVMPNQIPEGYFESLPLLCMTKVSVEQTIVEVPEGYFESLPELMLSKVRAMAGEPEELDEVAPLLKTISRTPVGYVPDGYFEKLSSLEADRWFGDERLIELKAIAPELLRFSQLNPGVVPEGYFAELPDIMLGKVQVPVRSMQPAARPLGRIMAVAAAAALIAGLWFGFSFDGSERGATNQSVVALAENELKETPQIEEALKNIDAESIAIYLNETSATPVVSFSNPDDVESVIKTLNSETLEHYLELMPSYPDPKSGEGKS